VPPYGPSRGTHPAGTLHPGSGPRGATMDGFSIRERLSELKKEIGEIRLRDVDYVRTRHHHWFEIRNHEIRVTRMKEIVDEISALMDAQKS
jgi:hypothetical protein